MASSNRGGGDVEMRNYSSSPTSLSSPPSGSISDPGSPSRLQQGRANIEMDEIVVDTASGPRFGVMQPPRPQPEVQLTAAGLPRKKPGRKPGSVVKPKIAADGTAEPKTRKPRKPRDPNAPPIQRKRKNPPATDAPAADADQRSASASAPTRQPKITELASMRMDVDSRPPSNVPQEALSQKVVKREAIPESMRSLLNRDPSPPPPPAAPVRSGGMAFDPVRSSSYDPVRETMFTRDPYGTAGLGSPRGPTNQMTNRASASPSISSLVDPVPSNMVSPPSSHQTFHNTTQSRFQESGSMPPSPSNAVRSAPAPPASKPSAEAKKAAAAPSVPSVAKIAEPLKPSNPTISGLANPQVASSAPSKKVASMQQQDRKEKKASSASSSPKMNGLKSGLSDVPDLTGPGSERSILDFGKAKPGDESSTPSIVLHIPLNGETNKYVNFMRLAEEQYGWDALHPRLAAHRERKARIAAASAALEKQGSGRESGDEMSVDLQSDGEGSNVEMGGMGNGGTSGPDGAPAKPARKKRNFKEDEYDKDDDFVDDSEMLWEEQAAASRDGFFVYSGPLVPEVEKPAAGYAQIPFPTSTSFWSLTSDSHDGPPKRGRGGRGRGSRGGRGGLSRDASAAAASGEGGEPVVKRRGGGPGSRGGSVARKPRITKLEKAQMASEKAEREKLASMSGKNGSSYSLLQGGSSPSSFAAGMVVDR